MTPDIPLWSYREEYVERREEILAACDRVFSSGRLILGEEGKAFEAAFAREVGVPDAAGVGNGTDAIVLALVALGVRAGDEVITVPNTAVPTVSAIETIGARPVFVDVGEDCLIDPARIEAAVTPRTRAIIPVHLFGQMADMDAIMAVAARHDLSVIEDTAQAQGARQHGRVAGTIGHAATYSFYPTKILGGYGDGGAVASRDAAVVERVRSLRFYGMERTYYAERPGYNSRLDEVQAAILSLKLPRLAAETARRREIAARYDAAFADGPVRPVGENPGNIHVYHLYVVESDRRESLMAALAAAGIGSGICYPWPIHTMRGYDHLRYAPDDFPVAMRKADRIMNLPMFPALPDAAVDRVIDVVRQHG